MRNPKVKLYKVKALCPFMIADSGQYMLQWIELPTGQVFAYMKMGIISKTDTVQVVIQMNFAMKGVRYRGEDIG